MPRRCFFLTVPLLVLAAVADAGQSQLAATDLHGDPLPAGALARLGTVRLRHDTTVVFAAFLPDGKRILSVSEDGVVCAWDFPSGKQIARFEALAGSTALVTGATLSPNGKRLTVMCDDGFLRVVDWADAKEVGKVANVSGGTTAGAPAKSALAKALARPTMPALAPVYSPDGNTLMLVGSSRVLQLVDVLNGKEAGPSPGHTEALTAIWFTPDGTRILTKDAKTTRNWNAATFKEMTSLNIKMPAIQGTPTVISPDGRFGVTVARFASPMVAQNATSRDAIIFDATTGKEVGVIPLEVEIAPTYRRPLHFSPDSTMLAVITGDLQHKIELYGIPSGKLLRTLEAGPAGKAGKKPFAAIAAQKILFTADGKALAFQPGVGAAIVVLDVETGKQIGSLPAVADSTPLLGAFSPDRRCLALENSDGTVTVFELATGQPRKTFGGKLPAPEPTLDDLLPLGGFGGGGGGPGGGLGVADRSKVRMAISPDSRLLVLSGLHGSIHVWDIWTAKELSVLKGHRVTVTGLAFAPNGKTLASASDDTTALLWDMTRIVRPAPAAKAPQAGDLEKWWEVLADNDAAKAFAAMGDFAAAPGEAVAWIKSHVPAAMPVDTKRALELIQQLDHDQFKVREKAYSELFKLGELVVPVLNKVLDDNPPLETKRRLEELRAKLTAFVLTGDRLRACRAVEVLEHIGTPEARQVLQTLADGAPGALVTTSAQAALKR
jgi:WD40 repeat protein